MSRLKIIIFATFTLLIVTIACRAVTDIFSPETEVLPTPHLPTDLASPAPTSTVEAPSCPVLLTDILSAATAEGGDIEAQEDQYIVTYAVNGDQLSDPYYESVSEDLQDEQDDNASHQFVWDYFTALIPADERTFLAEYSITTDGTDNTLAAVTQTYDDPAKWALEVDILDISNTYNLTFTFIHEFGHLLTLGPNQVPPSTTVFNHPEDENILQKEIDACPQYFPGEGCSKPSSYINTWYERFWVDIYEEWDELNYIEDDDTYYEQLDEFYYKYQDQFLTDYAVTTPEEDIAEAFAFFVLAPKPDNNSIANQKILFFYGYPEFITLRESILQNICTTLPSQ